MAVAGGEKVSDQQRRELIRLLQCEDLRKLRQVLRSNDEESPLLKEALDSSGNHALHLAILSGFEEGLELLLQHAACDVNVRTQWAETPLHLAVENEFNTMVQGLLATGNCNLDLVTKRRSETVLHVAARIGNTFATKELLTRPFNINAVDVDGNTALHLAVMKRRMEVTRLLLTAGLDPKAKNAQLKSPTFIAMRELNDQRLTEILVNIKRAPNARRPKETTAAKPKAAPTRAKPRPMVVRPEKHQGSVFQTEVPNISAPKPAAEKAVQETPEVTPQEQSRRNMKSACVQTRAEEAKALEVHEDKVIVQKPKSDFYKMEARPRGMCVIFNNETYWHDDFEERSGADVDENRLSSLFKRLNFRVRIHKNLNAAEMFWAVMNIAQHTDHSQFDCFACCILSHGSLGTIYGVDGDSFRISDLTIALTARRCPSLAGKPKMFFIQACRGEEYQGLLDDQNTHDAQIGADPASMVPDHADFLLSYATVAGYKAQRHRQNGSLYVQTLCTHVHAHHKDQDLLSILTKVNRETAEKVFEAPSGGKFKQMPEVRHTLTKAILMR